MPKAQGASPGSMSSGAAQVQRLRPVQARAPWRERPPSAAGSGSRRDSRCRRRIRPAGLWSHPGYSGPPPGINQIGAPLGSAGPRLPSRIRRRGRLFLPISPSRRRFLRLLVLSVAGSRSLLGRDEGCSSRLDRIERWRAQAGEVPANALFRSVGLWRPARRCLRLRSLLLHGSCAGLI